MAPPNLAPPFFTPSIRSGFVAAHEVYETFVLMPLLTFLHADAIS